MALSDLIGLDRYLQNEYAIAFGILVILLLIIRIGFTLIQKILLGLTKKTKTDIDDILLAKSSRPLTVIAFLIGLRVALAELTLGEALADNIALVIYSALVVVLAYLVYVILDLILIRGWKKVAKKSKTELDDNLAYITHGILKIVLIALATLYILDLWGIEILPLIGALGIAGLAVALALQPTLSNIFSGISMILDKSVSVGDWVKLEDGTSGVIDKIGIRSTRILTFDNELIVIPNSKFSDSRIQNVSMPEPKARVVIPFGVAYGSDIEKVKKTVEAEIKKLPNLDKESEITVRFLEMAESSLNFKAYFYVDSFKNRFSTIDLANTRIYNALNKAKISIPFPQMDVHLKKD